MSNLKQMALALLVGIGIGVYFADLTNPNETVTTKKQTASQTDTHTVKKTVTKKAPDGTVTKTTTVDTVTARNSQSTGSTDKSGPSKRLALEAIGMYKPGSNKLDYGARIGASHVLGPVGISAYLLRSGSVGIGIGMEF